MHHRPTVLVGMSMHPDAASHLALYADIQPLPANTAELASALATADGMIVYSPGFAPELLADAPRLKVISCHAYGPAIRAAARANNTQVTLVPSLWDTVADHAIGLMFAAARNIPQAHRAIAEGLWGGADLKVRFSGHDITGRTLGIIGLGKIGALIAKRMQGFDMPTLYSDTTPRPDLERSLGLRHTPLETLFSEADVIMIALPLDETTRGLIGAAELRRMKPDALLINIARGAIIQEAALVQALEAGWFAGAGLDVFAQEPLPPGHPLLHLNNVVLTPHLGGSTKECDMVLVNDTVRVLQGQPPHHPVA